MRSPSRKICRPSSSERRYSAPVRIVDGDAPDERAAAWVGIVNSAGAVLAAIISYIM
jgi:hypothetical protein